MKIQFLGAARVVTGSCYKLTIGNINFLVDCGMFQGREGKLNYEKLKFNPKEIDFVLLTHAHLDHCGMIPRLTKNGFNGPIYCTPATQDLTKVVLEDSAHIQEFENKWDNKHLAKEGKPLRQPLYSVKDAIKTFKLFRTERYNQTFSPAKDINVVFREAGHILGSAHIELFAEGKKYVFSGDIGQWNAPIINDPTCISNADVVICESTYGDRNHEKVADRNKLLIKAINDVSNRDGKLLIPSFAIERTQELLYRLNEQFEKGKLPSIPIFVDSPMANKATQVFINHTENYDEDARNHLAHGDHPFEFPNLKFTNSTQQSKDLNDLQGSAVIIAGSGMCTGGRIKHHIKNHMPKKETMMLFVGFQAYGSLGRRIKEGAKSVRIYGETIKMNGEIRSIDGFSGHADQKQLLKWLSSFKSKPKLFFTHGEESPALELKRIYGSGYVPKMYETIEI